MASQSTTVTDLQIRAATWDDASPIYAFMCALEEATLDQSAFLTVFRRNLADPAVYYLVAEASEVIGFVSCHVHYLLHHGGKVAEIQELFVRPDVRNQGIGHHLIKALLTLAIQERFINLEVTTNQKRADALRFYERESFHRTHIKLVKSIQNNDFLENK